MTKPLMRVRVTAAELERRLPSLRFVRDDACLQTELGSIHLSSDPLGSVLFCGPAVDVEADALFRIIIETFAIDDGELEWTDESIHLDRQNRWMITRQDDNGNVFEMSSHYARARAEHIAAEFEARGHKQTYSVTCFSSRLATTRPRSDR